MFTEGFISELVGRRATINDLPIGKVTDFLVRKPDATFPQIDGLIVKTVQGLRFAPIETVTDVDRNGNVVLTMAPKEPAPPDNEELYLVADLLDKQIVDVDGRKVVRINDIELANAGGRLRVVAADVGVAGAVAPSRVEIVRQALRAGNLPPCAPVDDRVGLGRADPHRQPVRSEPLC